MLVYGPNTYERTFMSLFSLVIYWKWTILWHNCFQRSQWNTSAWKNMFFSLEVLMKTAEHYNLFSLNMVENIMLKINTILYVISNRLLGMPHLFAIKINSYMIIPKYKF